MSELRIVPLGGLGEIGKNMTVVSQGGDMIVVDAGLSFPTEEMHGVDIVIPDITYLLENRDKVRGIVLTHGHEDHVGALPYVLDQLPVPVYGTELTIEMVRRKLNERLPGTDPELNIVSPGKSFKLGSFEVEPIHVTHSMPDCCSLAITTKVGVVIFSGDFKFDFTPVDGRQTDLSRFGELGDKGVIALLSDCTNAESAGWSESESSVSAAFRREFKAAPGRVLITTFASNIHRMQQAFDVAEETGRIVTIAGRRMEETIRIASMLKKMNFNKDNLIRLQESSKYQDNELVILTTGTQGEPLSALSLMAKEEYPKMKIRPGDTVIYSAKPIPGNEAAIWQTVNRLFRQGAHVVYGPEAGAHVSGHAHQEELKLLINLTRPDYLVPVHGEPRHQYAYGKLAEQMGYSHESIVPLENGSQLVIEPEGAYLDESVVCGRVLVDSSGYAGVTDELLRDRRNLASDGVVFLNVAIDSDAGKVVGRPELFAKGVSTQNGELDKLRDVLDDLLRNLSKAEMKDTAAVHQEVSDVARQYIKKATNKRPLVVASVVDV